MRPPASRISIKVQFRAQIRIENVSETNLRSNFAVRANRGEAIDNPPANTPMFVPIACPVCEGERRFSTIGTGLYSPERKGAFVRSLGGGVSRG